jgi:hypothetical protein
MKPTIQQVINSAMEDAWFDLCDYGTIESILNADEAKVHLDYFYGDLEDEQKIWMLEDKHGATDLLPGTFSESIARACAATYLVLWHLGLPFTVARDLATAYWRDEYMSVDGLPDEGLSTDDIPF